MAANEIQRFYKYIVSKNTWLSAIKKETIIKKQAY